MLACNITEFTHEWEAVVSHRIYMITMLHTAEIAKISAENHRP